MIIARNVYLEYPDGTQALKDISLEIDPGELVYILGPSGSGKTSLLKLFMAIEYPTRGSLQVLDKPMDKAGPAAVRSLRRLMGPVFQDFKLINGRTVFENVLIGMRFLEISSGLMKVNAKEALEKVGLEHKTFSLVDNLSWGERQRVVIARAAARKPSLILADEPTGNLDHDNAVKILDLLSSFRDDKTSVIITTHATHLLDDRHNYRCIALNNGSIVKDMKGC
ncbi:cell division ATP-binding protein FtsE [Desulfitibacter alkalitolerans]|uniref:cell division ATP-binding protein FtsE n=1 Tax=Desulfitibacter alkalitolerans TaxID=264641 RepID=UPI000486E08C|nr:ATP-binding cassette domain-containing protein [Desulfitibacter alkalitolerans]